MAVEKRAITREVQEDPVMKGICVECAQHSALERCLFGPRCVAFEPTLCLCLFCARLCSYMADLEHGLARVLGHLAVPINALFCEVRPP